MQDRIFSKQANDSLMPSERAIGGSEGSKALGFYQAVFDAAPTAAILTGSSGAIEAINRAGAVLFRVRQKACIGKSLHLLLADESSWDDLAAYLRELPNLRRNATREWHINLKPSRGRAVRAKVIATHPDVSSNSDSTIAWSFLPDPDPDLTKEQEHLLADAAGLRNLVSAVIENSSHGMVFLSGHDLRVQWINPATAKMLSAPLDRGIIGLRAEEILTKKEDSPLLDKLRQVVKTNMPYVESEYEFHGFDRGITFWQLLAIPIPDEAAGSPNILALIQDVTPVVNARKRTERAAAEAEGERRLLETVVESLPLGLLITDAEGGILRSNETRSQIWGGFEPASSIEDYRQYKGWFPGTGHMVRPDEWPLARALQRGEVLRHQEIQIERFDGVKRIILISALPIRDSAGAIVGGVSTIQDVTEQRQSEKDLAQEKQKAEGLAQERLDYLERLNRLIAVSQDVLSETTVVGLLERMADVACELTGARIGLSGFRYEKGRFETGVIARTGKSYRHLHGGRFRLSEGEIHEELIQRKRSFHFTETELREERESIGLPNSHILLRGLVGAPLVGRNGESMGVIMVSDRSEGVFTGEDEALLKELAAIASLSLHHIEAATAEQQRAEEMHAIFMALVDQVIIYDTNGKATKANSAAIEALGFSPEGHSRAELIDKLQMRHLDGSPVAPENLPSTIALRGVPVSGMHYQMMDVLGRKFIAQVSCAPIRSGNQIIGAVCALRDVTERENLLVQLKAEREIAEKRALEAEESRRLFEALLEHVPEGVGIADAKTLQMIYLSQHGLQMLGLSAPQPKDLDVAAMLRMTPFYTPDNVPAIVSEVPLARAIHREMQIIDEEWTVETVQGQRRIILCNAAPLRDRHGNVTEGILVWRDITDRKRTEEAVRASEEFQSAILNAVDSLIAVLDSEGTIIAVNAAWLRSASIAGHHSLHDLAVGANYLQVCQNASGAGSEAAAAFEGIESVLLRRAPNYQMEYSCGLPQEKKWFLMTAVCLPGGVRGAVISHTEITGAKRAEEELRQTTRELQRSNRDLLHFAHTVSHDLREPLRGVVGHLQLLRRKYGDQFDPEGAGLIDFVLTSGDRMSQMIEGLLNYARVGSQGGSFCVVDSEKALRMSLLNLEQAIAESNAIVTHDPLPSVIADELQLAQLFQNLIGNGVKFCREEPPRVHISAAPTEECWIFSVRDNGIGIDPKHHQKIFDIFARLDRSRNYAGSGVGLTVCKRIIGRHGGRIWVESREGEGSTFFFTLPKRDGASSELDDASITPNAVV